MLALAMQFFLSLPTKWNYDLASNLLLSFALPLVNKLVRFGKYLMYLLLQWCKMYLAGKMQYLTSSHRVSAFLNSQDKSFSTSKNSLS